MEQRIFTVGHSNHKQEDLVGLLRAHGVSAVCDVRSQPYSRFNPQFNRDDLKDFLGKFGIVYSFLGKELGARSQDLSCYEDGRVQYSRLAETALFKSGIERLYEDSQRHCIVLMCAEREPLDCHRTILVSRYLFDMGWRVNHIHADGSSEDHTDAISRLVQRLAIPNMFLSPTEVLAEAYRRQSELIAYSLPSTENNEADTYRSALH